jgi:hypothetical protein
MLRGKSSGTATNKEYARHQHVRAATLVVYMIEVSTGPRTATTGTDV